MNKKVFASYLRVSTQKQGRSGLGLDAQRKMCEDFVNNKGGVITHEFVDVESGTHRNRKGLQDAISFCKENECALVIAKLDRLARDVEFCFKVVNTGIEIHFTDMPQMNTLLLGVFASVAQYERELTSERTKKALAVKKAQGCKLGAANENYTISKENLRRRSLSSGATRSRRVLEEGDTQALIRIMKKVFPKCASHAEHQWRSSFVNTRSGTREQVLALMKDYKELDQTGVLFKEWDFSDLSSRNLQHRLASKMQTVIKLLTN